MIRIIKEWWLIRQLYAECQNHEKGLAEEVLIHNSRFVIARDAMIAQVAKNSIRRFSWILRWRRKINQEKLNKRIREYQSIMDTCLRDDYVCVDTNELKDDSGVIINANRPFIRTTDLGDSFMSFSSLTIALGKQLSTIGIIVAWFISLALTGLGTYLAFLNELFFSLI